MFKNFDIAVDTTKGVRNQAISVNTNDLQTLQFSFTITQSGVPIDLTGSTVRLAVKKPDKNTVFQDCTITDAIAGKCEIILDTQAYIVPGLHPVELMVYYAVDQVSVTGRFSYTANKGILDDGSVVSTNEFQAINQAIADVEGIVVDLRDNGTGIDAQARSELETVTTQLAETANEIPWVSVANFPLIILETDDTARINRAIASISKGTILVPIGTYNISGNGITIPNGINLQMSPSAEFVYSGTGVAITFEGNLNANHVISKLRRNIAEWKTTDTSSIGIRLSKNNHSNFFILYCANFNVGIQMYSVGNGTGTNSNGGTCYNTLTLGRVEDNKNGIQFYESNFGWANGNTFIGGAIRINSNNGGVVGSRLIDLSTTGNGNVFIGVNMEGGVHDKTVVVKYSNNTFINCRMELNPENSWHFLSTSSNNQVIGGYGNFGVDSKPQGDGKRVFLDEGKGNFILGGRGLKLSGDNGQYGGDALILEGLSSGSDILLRGQNFNKQVYSTLSAVGVLSLYSGQGKYDATNNTSGQQNPVIRINPTNYSIETGRTDGTEVPTALLTVYTAARTDLKKTLYNNGGRIAGSFVLIAGATPDVSTSNLFKTNNIGAVTITSFAAGITGQVITVIGNDANTTIANNANILLKGAVNFTMKVNDSIQLVKLDTGAWLEITRTVI